jgi:Zn-dependent protease with chaperone function
MPSDDRPPVLPRRLFLTRPPAGERIRRLEALAGYRS